MQYTAGSIFYLIKIFPSREDVGERILTIGPFFTIQACYDMLRAAHADSASDAILFALAFPSDYPPCPDVIRYEDIPK